MKPTQTLPSPYDLAEAPVLAIIAVLELTLEMTVRALFAEHPDLCDQEKPYWIPTTPVTRAAKAIVYAIDSLGRKLARYRSLLPLEPEFKKADDEIS
jgi:hypothetical protein